MNNKIFVEVKKIDKDNKHYLCFIYPDKLIKPENTYEVFDEGEPYIERNKEKYFLDCEGKYIELNKKKYFLDLGSDGNPFILPLSDGEPYTETNKRKCFLIYKKSQIKSRIKEKEGDFENCIFLIGVNFSFVPFDEKVNFRGAIFTEDVYFSGTFTKKTDFSKAIFVKKAGFWGAEFAGNANFYDARFVGNADFQYVKFAEQTDFYSAKFVGNADFKRTTFAEQADFKRTTFAEQAIFENAKFTKQANFSDVKFSGTTCFKSVTFTKQANFLDAKFSQNPIDFTQAQFLTALSFNGVESITLNLDQSQLDKIYYDTDCKFSAGNRETFLILKSIALKQNDKIKAVEFHTQEYEQHHKKIYPEHFITYIWLWVYGDKQSSKLKKPFISTDWIILGFEYFVSKFGTSIIFSVFWYFMFAGLFYLFMNGYDVVDAETIITKTFINFIIPTNIAVKDFLINNNSSSSLDYVLFAFYKFGQIILLYEMIKSFRKYSRSL